MLPSDRFDLHGSIVARALLLCVVLASSVSACSDGVVRPETTVIIPYPKVSCPAPVAVTAPGLATSAAVSYAAPLTTNGTAPVTTTCTPASGSTFAAGVTAVTCKAIDSVNRQDSCSFNVTVVVPPRLTIRTILAFGDSITEGEVPVAGEFFPSLVVRHYVQPDNAYPSVVRKKLAERYFGDVVGPTVNAFSINANNTGNDCQYTNPPLTPSAINVINAGCLGEKAQESTTLARFRDKIQRYNPDVILLMEGTNDLDSANPNGSIAAGVAGVLTLVMEARNRGIPIVVSTIAPQVKENQTHGGAPELVDDYNGQLRSALGGLATIVEGNAALAANKSAYISAYDGLHPTADGYAELARVWFDAIVARYEQRTTVNGYSAP